MRIRAAFVQTLASQMVQSVASVGTGVIIARGLGPQGQGNYATFAAGVGLGAVVAALGQFHGNVLATADRKIPPRLLVIRAVAHGAAVAALLLATLPLWGPLLQAGSTIPTAFAVVLALEVVAQMVRAVNLGQQRVIAWNLASLTQRVGYLGLVAGLAVAARVRLSSVVLCWALATTISVVVSGVAVWRSTPAERFSLESLRRGWIGRLGQGLRPFAAIVLSLLLVRADVWMMRVMLGVATVGQISVATYLAEWLWYVPSILGNLLFAAVAADAGQRSLSQVARATRAVAALLLPVMAVLLLLGQRVVVVLYGSAYSEAGLLFTLLLPGMTALGLHLVVDSYFAGRGFPPITIWGAGVALLLKVTLNLVLVPRWGAPGAAVATSIAYVCLLGIKVAAIVRQTGMRTADLLLPGAADAAYVVTLLRQRLGSAPTAS